MRRFLLVLAACGGDPMVLRAVDAAPDAEGTPAADASYLDSVKIDSSDAGCQEPIEIANCDESYATPPVHPAGWSKVLSRTGMLTLTHDVDHIHDDLKGPLGFCPAKAKCGEKYLALVSARYETDQQDKNITEGNHCVVDYTQPDPMMMKYGMCFSGGNRHIYIEVRDENGKRITQGEGVSVTSGGMTMQVPDQGKPANEFPINVPMYGGGVRYRVRATYTNLPSDSVTNMRMPLNHHVNFLLTFQIRTR